MKRIIDAGSARLAGLQIDILQKVRKGVITLDQWERFNNLSVSEREALFGDWKPQPKASAEPIDPPAGEAGKFALLADLGILTVPAGYDPATASVRFNANFSNPSRVLKPGDKFRVRVWKQIGSRTTTFLERMDFCRKQVGNCFTGAQGLSQVFDSMRDKLPKGFWYSSFDEVDRLPVVGGCPVVPYVDVHSDGDFEFVLGRLESIWRDYHTFVSFCDQSLVA